MSNQFNTVLIFGQSGRFLAQSASQAGYCVWLADCFGDHDSQFFADRWQQLPALSQLSSSQIISQLSQLSNNEPCCLICGSGIEHHYQFLDDLPQNIQLVGNCAQTIAIIKTASLFFNLLDTLNISYPATYFSCPSDSKNYIAKSDRGYGGIHIQPATPSLSADYYYQYLIEGLSGSALFLADGTQAQLISINQQYLKPTSQWPFRLGRIDSHWKIGNKHRDCLIDWLNKITQTTALVGLNSLDFIISTNDELLLLEVNPRPSASVELITEHDDLFQSHINACHGQLPEQYAFNADNQSSSLFYLFAANDSVIPNAMVWPNECHDIPITASIISKDQPICTVLISGLAVDKINARYAEIEAEVCDQVQPRNLK